MDPNPDPNQHYFGKLDEDPQLCEEQELDPDPHSSNNLEVLEAQNGAIRAVIVTMEA